MKFSIFRDKKKEGGVALSIIKCNDLIEKQKSCYAPPQPLGELPIPYLLQQAGHCKWSMGNMFYQPVKNRI